MPPLLKIVEFFFLILNYLNFHRRWWFLDPKLWISLFLLMVWFKCGIWCVFPWILCLNVNIIFWFDEFVWIDMLLMIMCIIVEFVFTVMNMCYCGLILCSIDIILLYDDYVLYSNACVLNCYEKSRFRLSDSNHGTVIRTKG